MQTQSLAARRGHVSVAVERSRRTVASLFDAVRGAVRSVESGTANSTDYDPWNPNVQTTFRAEAAEARISTSLRQIKDVGEAFEHDGPQFAKFRAVEAAVVNQFLSHPAGNLQE